MSDKGFKAMMQSSLDYLSIMMPAGTSADGLTPGGGFSLNLTFEGHISAEIAKCLVNYYKCLNLKFKNELPVEAAKELAKHRFNLELDGPISEEARQILAKRKICGSVDGMELK